MREFAEECFRLNLSVENNNLFVSDYKKLYLDRLREMFEGVCKSGRFIIKIEKILRYGPPIIDPNNESGSANVNVSYRFEYETYMNGEIICFMKVHKINVNGKLFCVSDKCRGFIKSTKKIFELNDLVPIVVKNHECVNAQRDIVISGHTLTSMDQYFKKEMNTKIIKDRNPTIDAETSKIRAKVSDLEKALKQREKEPLYSKFVDFLTNKSPPKFDVAGTIDNIKNFDSSKVYTFAYGGPFIKNYYVCGADMIIHQEYLLSELEYGLLKEYYTCLLNLQTLLDNYTPELYEKHKLIWESSINK